MGDTLPEPSRRTARERRANRPRAPRKPCPTCAAGPMMRHHLALHLVRCEGLTLAQAQDRAAEHFEPGAEREDEGTFPSPGPPAEPPTPSPAPPRERPTPPARDGSWDLF